MTIEVTYYTGGKNKNTLGLPVISETVTSGNQSAVTPAGCSTIRIVNSAASADRWAYGANPTATNTAGANGHYLPAGGGIDIPAVAGYKLSVITSA